jgi:desulfoferrodoxin (superoxide reductase-like protein)
MKIGTIGIICLMLVMTVLLPSQVIAHPPQNMILDFDFESQVLSVTITHNSPAPSVHYVNSIEIKRNDEVILTESYDSQPTTTEYTYTFAIEASSGDVLDVTAICNIQGSIARSITVRDPAQDDPPVIEIVNPTEGYFHFSGIRLFPTIGLIADTMGFGGFRLQPLQMYTEDDVDDSSDLIVKAFIDDEELGTATYNTEDEVHEIKWTGPNLGTFTLSVTAEDSLGNIGEDEMQVWYFCFIP